jgi:TRAP-type C4-dicarboxylate transport system permease small subunit
MTSDGLKRVIRTFLIAFFGIFIPGAFQFLNEITQWATSEGQKPFPDMHSASFILVAAVVAGAIALLNLVVNWIEDTTGKGFLRTVPPKPEPPAGD